MAEETPKPDSAGGKWIKLGGASVQVDESGEIVKGCPGLKGHNVDELDETQDHRAAKQEAAEQAGWKSQEEQDAETVWKQAREKAPPHAIVLAKIGDKLYAFGESALKLKDSINAGDGRSAQIEEKNLQEHLKTLTADGHRVAIVERTEEGNAEPAAEIEHATPQQPEPAEPKAPQATATDPQQLAAQLARRGTATAGNTTVRIVPHATQDKAFGIEKIVNGVREAVVDKPLTLQQAQQAAIAVLTDASGNVPQNVAERVRAAIKGIQGYNAELARGRELDKKFGGEGRYEHETHLSRQADLAAHLKDLETFRKFAPQNGVDADKHLQAWGHIEPEQPSQDAQEWAADQQERDWFRDNAPGQVNSRETVAKLIDQGVEVPQRILDRYMPEADEGGDFDFSDDQPPAPTPPPPTQQAAHTLDTSAVPGPLKKTLDDLAQTRDFRKTGQIATQELHPDYAKSIYEDLKKIQGKGDGHGDVYDLSEHLGYGAIGYHSPLGVMAVIPPRGKNDSWEVRLSKHASELQQPAQQPAQQSAQQPAQQPAQQAPAPRQAEEQPKRRGRDRLGEAVREAVGDDPEHQAGFRQFVEEVWKEKYHQAQMENDAVRELLGIWKGSDPASAAVIRKGDAAGKADTSGRGGGKQKIGAAISQLRKLMNSPDFDETKLPGFDQLVDHAKRHHPWLLHNQGGEFMGAAGDDGYTLLNRLSQGIKPLPNPWDDEVINEALAYGSGIKPIEMTPEERAAHEEEMLKFHRTGMKLRYHQWQRSKLSRWRLARQLSLFDQPDPPPQKPAPTLPPTTPRAPAIQKSLFGDQPDPEFEKKHPRDAEGHFATKPGQAPPIPQPPVKPPEPTPQPVAPPPTKPEAAPKPSLKILGVSDEVTTCDHCGKQNLKCTVAIEKTDADGNSTGDIEYWGRDCAAKAKLGDNKQSSIKSVEKVGRGIEAAKKVFSSQDLREDAKARLATQKAHLYVNALQVKDKVLLPDSGVVVAKIGNNEPAAYPSLAAAVAAEIQDKGIAAEDVTHYVADNYYTSVMTHQRVPLLQEVKQRLSQTKAEEPAENTAEEETAEPVEKADIPDGWQVRYTTAPANYDGFGTKDLGEAGTDRGQTVRKVAVDPEHLQWQSDRYGSGMHPAHDQQSFDQLANAGIIARKEAEKTAEPTGPDRFNPQVGDVFDMPAVGTRMPLKMKLYGIENGHAIFGREGREKEYSDPKMRKAPSFAVVPQESVTHFIDDMTGKLSLPADSEDERINQVIRGEATYLGKGDDSAAYDTGSHVVKVGTTTPFQPENPGHRTPQEAMERTRSAYETAKDLYKAGVPGIPIQSLREHHDPQTGYHRAFVIMPKLDTTTPLSKEQLEQVRDSVEAMHAAGYAINDQIQVGIDPKTGKVYHYDLGKAEKVDEKNRDYYFAYDQDELQMLYDRNGQKWSGRKRRKQDEPEERATEEQPLFPDSPVNDPPPGEATDEPLLPEPPADLESQDDLNPRERATQSQKSLLESDDSPYAFARSSAVPNRGEDAFVRRHKANLWKGLAAAEADGTAQQMITRDRLLKAEPHDLVAIAQDNPIPAMVMHLALKSFPPQPGYGRSKGNHESERAQRNRRQYYEAYVRLKGKAEEIARKETNPIQAAMRLNAEIGSVIQDLRDQKVPDKHGEMVLDRYNDTANALVSMSKRLQQSQKTGVFASLREFMGAVKEKYGDDQADDDAVKRKVSAIKNHIQDIIEGSSIAETFGTQSKRATGPRAKVDDFDELAFRQEIPLKRVGGRQLDAKSGNAAADHLVDKMKMRGVVFGNYVNDHDRSYHAVLATEAMMDLADILGIDDSDTSLSGQLFLAIGANGRGKAASATYHPDQRLINLTRNRGAGTLAHEWGHALDHWLNGGTTFTKDGRLHGSFLSRITQHATQEEAVGPRGVAMHGVMASFHTSGYRERIYHVTRGEKPGRQEYWRAPHELFARAFESYVAHKLDQNGRTNTYLAAPMDHKYWPTKQEMEKMAPAFDALIKFYRENRDKIEQQKPEIRKIPQAQ